MKSIKVMICLIISLAVSCIHASKLSEYLRKERERDHVRTEREWQQDMMFSDYVFRLDRRFDESNSACRSYTFRSRTNPYRTGSYTVCDDRWGRPFR